MSSVEKFTSLCGCYVSNISSIKLGNRFTDVEQPFQNSRAYGGIDNKPDSQCQDTMRYDIIRYDKDNSGIHLGKSLYIEMLW